MKKRTALIVLLFITIMVLLSGCTNEKNIIALRKIKYNTQRAVLELSYFAQKNAAELYFSHNEIKDYYLFKVPSKDAESFFNKLDGQEIDDNQKEITFTADNEQTAIDKVVDFLEENDFVRIAGPPGE